MVIKVFIASRPVRELESRKRKFHNFIRLQDETKPSISRFTKFLATATDYIVEHAQGVFIWVRLVKDELLNKI